MKADLARLPEVNRRLRLELLRLNGRIMPVSAIPAANNENFCSVHTALMAEWEDLTRLHQQALLSARSGDEVAAVDQLAQAQIRITGLMTERDEARARAKELEKQLSALGEQPKAAATNGAAEKEAQTPKTTTERCIAALGGAASADVRTVELPKESRGLDSRGAAAEALADGLAKGQTALCLDHIRKHGPTRLSDR